MTRARSYVEGIETDVATAIKTVRAALNLEDGTELDTAMCYVETFCDVAIRVMKKTNPSKIRDEARTVEIKARMDGVPVVLDEIAR